MKKNRHPKSQTLFQPLSPSSLSQFQMSGISSSLRKTNPSTIVNHGSRSLDFLNNALKNSTVTNSSPTSDFKIDDLPELCNSKYVHSSKVSVHPFLIPSPKDRFLATFKRHGYNYGDINKIDVTGGVAFEIKRNFVFNANFPAKERIQWLQENFPLEELSNLKELPKFEVPPHRYQLSSLNELPDLIEPLDAVAKDSEIDRETKLDYFVYKLETEPEQCIHYIMENLQNNEALSATTFIKVVHHIISVHSGSAAKIRPYSSEIIRFYQFLNDLNPEKVATDLEINHSLLSYFIHAGYIEQASFILDKIFIEQNISIDDALFTKFIKNHFRDVNKSNRTVKLEQLYPFRSALFSAFNPQILKTLMTQSETFPEIHSLIRIAKFKDMDIRALFISNEQNIVNKLTSLIVPKSPVSELTAALSQFQPDITKLSSESIIKLIITTLKSKGSYIYAARLVKLLGTVDKGLVDEVYKIDNKREVYLEVGKPGYDQVTRNAFFQILNEKTQK